MRLRKEKKNGYRAWTKEEIQWFIQQRFVSAPCRTLHSSICKRQIGWGWKCSALSSSRAQPLGALAAWVPRWEHWLPECLGGPSSSRGSDHSQGGVPPLGQIAHSDWSKERLQLIGPLALSQDNSEGDLALPPFLHPVLLCFPAFRWRPQGVSPSDSWQPTHLRSVARASSLRQGFSWSSDERNRMKLSWFPFLQSERRVHKGKWQPGKCSNESEMWTKEKAANWGWWSTIMKNAEKERELRIFKSVPWIYQ